MPFGEELFGGPPNAPGVGGRTTTTGYTASDGARQHFTGYERDAESGLDYAHARYYSSTQGRFSGPDIPFVDQVKSNPQSWNLYSYVGNKPLTYTDPYGLWKKRNDCEGNSPQCYESDRKNDTYASLAKILHVRGKDLGAFFQNEKITIGHVFDVSGFFANNAAVAQAQPTYFSVIVFAPSFRDPRSAFGHVAYNINGKISTWELHGWIKPPPIYQDYFKANEWRSSWEYVLGDPDDPEWTMKLAEKIQEFKGDGDWPYTDVPYGHVHDNCGEPFIRAINRTPGVPNAGGFVPVEIQRYIMNSLRPYVRQIIQHPRKR